MADIFAVKREYQPSSQIEEIPCCCEITPEELRSPEEELASQKKLAQLEMGCMPHLSALTDDTVELLALAWNDPTGAIKPLADMCGPIHADRGEIAEARDRWSTTRWRAAVRLLEELDLGERARGRFKCFELTWRGYRVAGMIHRGGRPPKP
jgi:hypothetical protein